jgi:catechol 2,3-dioxygenase-like lactoylglutathione lyase family enzyme
MSENSKQFIGSAPFFLVGDLQKSLDYYCDCLGFSRPKLWGTPPDFAMPSRDGFIFMLKQAKTSTYVSPNGKKDHYWDAYVWINDADALFGEYQQNGATIDYEICIQNEYDMKEFAIKDPDGYVIAFGQHHEA